MHLTDPIGDMITRINNAKARLFAEVTMPSSRHRVDVAKVLEKEGYIEGFAVTGEGKKTLAVQLKYDRDNESCIDMFRRASKPGCRVYARMRDLPKVRNGLGVVIVSTSQGVMSDRDARSKNLGGEILCYVA